MTSRRQMWPAVSGVQVLSLSELSRDAGLELLLSSRAQLQQKPVAALLQDFATSEAAIAVYQNLGGLPLALALAAAYLEAFSSMKIAEYREQLTVRLLDHPSLVTGLDTPLPTQHDTHVAATIGLLH